MNQPVESDDFSMDQVVNKKPGATEDLAALSFRRLVAGSDASPRRRGWRINYWLLAGSLLAVVILGPSLYFWRNYQVYRNADLLVRQAKVMEMEGDWRAAAEFYHRFLQLVPGAREVVLARAQAFDKSAVTPDRADRAIPLLYQAIDAAPENLAVRSRLVNRLYEKQRWEGAREQALAVLELDPDNLEAARIAALAYRAQLGPRRAVAIIDVVAAHESALEKHPGDPELSDSLASIYRENRNSFSDLAPEQVDAKADGVIDRMVAERPGDDETLLTRYRHRRKFNLEGAREDLERILKKAPDSPEILSAASAEFLTSDLERSLQFAQRLLQMEPEADRSYQQLVEVQMRMGKVDEAIETINQGLSEIGAESYPLQRTLLGLALETRRIELAETAWEALDKWRRRFSSYLQRADRRRLDEDLQVTKARLEMLRGDADLAVTTLIPLTTRFTEGSDADENLRQREQRWQLLAAAYGEMQQWDLAAQAMAEAARLRPAGYQSLLAQARFVRSAGNLDRAVQLAEEAAKKPGAPADVWLVVAEMFIESEMQRTSGQPRDWRRFHSALERAKSALEGMPPYVALRARWALADGRPADALAELQLVLPTEEIPLEYARELALLFAATGDSESAESLVKRLLSEPRFADQGEATGVELIARSRDYDGARQQLEEIAASGLESEKKEILARLITLELEAGFIQEARQRLARLRDQGPNTVPLLELGASLALQGKQWEELAKYTEALERLEGPKGTVWRFYKALTSLETRSDQRGGDLVEAVKLAKELENLRPQWPSNLVVRGRLAERQGKPDEALGLYEEAIRQGATSIIVIDWLVAGLYKQNRFAEAIEYLRRIGPWVGASSQLSGLALPAYLREGRTEDAVRIARMSAEFHPGDALPQMLYGQALLSAKDPEQAEIQFQRATELAPNDIRTWSGLIWFLAQTQQFDQVRNTLDRIVDTVALAPAERSLLMARGLAMIGDRTMAAQHYQVSLDARPDDPRMLEEVAQFYLQFDLQRALQLYRRVLEISPESIVARRSVALILGMAGTDEGLAEALQLLPTRNTTDSSPLDERLKSILLMRGSESQKEEAVELLTRYITVQVEVAPIDRLLLARALELAGRSHDAEQQYDELLSATESPDITSMYVAFLLRQQQYEKADEWLTKLELRDAVGRSSVMLRAEWLAAMDRADEIESLVQQYVAKRTESESGDQLAALNLAVVILRQHGRLEATERLLRSFAAISPAGGDLLVGFLGAQKRMGEALQLGVELSARHADERPPLAMLQVLTLLAARKDPEGLLHQDAEEQLAEAKKRHSEDVRFLFDLGTLRVMQGRDAEAIDLYEATLRLRPDYLPSMNNLAIILSTIPERREEALAMIERVMSLAPNSDEVKDSHALVLIGCERYADAKAILSALVAGDPGNPRHRFHLAVAHEFLGETSDAQTEFHAALEQGLEGELLTPAEDDYASRLSERHGASVSNGKE